MCSHSAHTAPFVLRVTTSRLVSVVIVRIIIIVVEIMIALVVFLVEGLSGDLAQKRLSRMRGVVEGSALGLETSL